MKLVVIGLRGVPGVMGGVETHCEELLPRLAALAGPRLAIAVAARARFTGPEPYSFAGLEVRPGWAPRSTSLEALVHSLLAVLSARLRHRADAVHVHAVGPGLAVPLARLLGLTVLFTHHGEDYRRAKWSRLGRAALRTGEMAALRLAHVTIAVSPSLRARLAARFPSQADRIVYVPNGAPPPPADAADAQADTWTRLAARFDLSRDGFVLAVGRLVPEKNLHLVVDAHERLPEAARRACPLLIVGDAQGESAYADALRARAGDTVRFAGRLTRGEIDVLLRAARLFVLASSHEGLPISALEALSAGCPCLLSDIGPNLDLELAAENYVPVGDVEALAARLAEPESVPRHEPETVRRRFDWDEIARQTLAALERAAGPAWQTEPAR